MIINIDKIQRKLILGRLSHEIRKTNSNLAIYSDVADSTLV